MSFVSYAQNFEDVLLHRVFGGQETGFYVDVGAYDPIEGSITKTFYDRGWSGINLEPGTIFEKLAVARPRDVNLQMAVLDRTGEVSFVEVSSDLGMSHIIEDGVSANTRIVPCDTLENIVRAHSLNRPVDFLKVDAEGAEGAIIRSTDWRRFRPRVLVFEGTRPWSTALSNQDWEPILLEQGFVRIYFDGINCFYVPSEEHATLERHFRAPVNVLDRATRYDAAAVKIAAEAAAEDQRLRAELDSARQAIETLGNLRMEYERLQAGHDALVARAETADADLARTAKAADAVEQARLALEQQHDRLKQEHADIVQSHVALAVEHDGTVKQLTACSDERATLRTERNKLEIHCDGLAAESEALHEQLRTVGLARETLAINHANLQSRHDSLAVERNIIASERDSLAAERNALTARLDEVVAERDRLGALLQFNESKTPLVNIARAPALHTAVAAPQLAARKPSRRGLAKRFALLTYKIARPVVRSLAWRARSFIVSGVKEQMDTAALRSMGHVQDMHSETLREMQSVRHATIADLQRLVRDLPYPAAPSPHPPQQDSGALDELRRLAAEIENAMLTMALMPSVPPHATHVDDRYHALHAQSLSNRPNSAQAGS